MTLRQLLRNRDFDFYWLGVVFSQVGVRGTLAVNLFHVFLLTDSTAKVGLVGLAQLAALLLLSPLGGAYADRVDRVRLLQVTQALSMLATGALGLLTLSDLVAPWHIYASVLINTATATFDQPARQALIPALVPREQLPQAFALLNPSREIAILVGPALGGLLVSAVGPEAMYLFDAVTYALLIVVLAALRIPKLTPESEPGSLWESIAEGIAFVRNRPIIWNLMALDLSAMVFGAYRVVLPALAVDVMDAGPAAYGLLAAAPSAGALVGSAVIFKLVGRPRTGRLVLVSTAGYGLMCVALAQSPGLAVGVAAALGVGFFDALATTVRHAAVQLETPDEIRGRVSSLYQMASRGGPAFGDANIGWVAGALGPVTALTLGGLVPVVAAAGLAAGDGRIKNYQMPAPSAPAGG